MFYHFNMGLSKKIKGDKLIIKTSEVRHSNVLIILFCYQNRNLISLIKSYPVDWNQFVLYDSYSFYYHIAPSGVPQGPILVPEISGKLAASSCVSENFIVNYITLVTNYIPKIK